MHGTKMRTSYLQFMYESVRMVFIFKCVTVTLLLLFMQRFNEKHDLYCTAIP